MASQANGADSPMWAFASLKQSALSQVGQWEESHACFSEQSVGDPSGCGEHEQRHFNDTACVGEHEHIHPYETCVCSLLCLGGVLAS